MREVLTRCCSCGAQGAVIDCPFFTSLSPLLSWGSRELPLASISLIHIGARARSISVEIAGDSMIRVAKDLRL